MVGAILGAWLTAASPARAQEPPQRPAAMGFEGLVRPPPPDPDPMVPTGIALTSVAGVGIVTATGMLATAADRGTQVCGFSGCLQQRDETYRIGALSLMTGSIALGVVGGGVLLGGATGEPRVRHHEGFVVAGSTLTGLGLASVTAGISALAAQSNSVQLTPATRVEPWAGTLIGLGAATAIVGIPLWGVGAQDWTPPPDGAPRRVAREYSPRMKTAGIVLTSIGIVSFLSSGATFIAALDADGFGGIGLAVLSSGLSLGGIVFTGIGSPLWAVGAHDAVDTTEAQDTPAAPEVRLGAGSMELTWTY